MAQKGRSLVSLATSKNKVANKSVVKKQEVVVKAKTPEEIRDIKAKETVNKLLEDVNLTPKDNIETNITTTITSESKKEIGSEWLQEQVTLLASENENLKNELIVIKGDYQKIFSEMQKIKNGGSSEFVGDTLNQNILIMFSELQNNLLGHNAEKTVWTTVNIKHILNQMLMMFPFTSSISKI